MQICRTQFVLWCIKKADIPVPFAGISGDVPGPNSRQNKNNGKTRRYSKIDIEMKKK